MAIQQAGFSLRLLLAAATILSAFPARASESGGSAYPHGAEGWGVGALPPPGNYLIGYASTYRAGRFNDRKGRSAAADFRVEADAATVRWVHVTDRKILGGNVAFHVLVPLVDLKVGAGGRYEQRTGVGDIVINPFMLGWHLDKLHVVTGIDIYLPTGRYERGGLANIGRNAVTFEPVLALTYSDPAGPELSAKLMYAVNLRNRATRYRSGDEFHVDFAGGWTRGPLTVGLSGYYAVQISDDRRGGSVVRGSRGTVVALGPSVRYRIGKVPVMLSWQRELEARNRPQGDKLWLKAVVPLGR